MTDQNVDSKLAIANFISADGIAAGRRMANIVIDKFDDKVVTDDTGRRIVEIAATDRDDKSAARSAAGMPKDLVDDWRDAYGVGYAARMSQEYAREA